MKKMLKKRIPTILGIFLLLVGIAAGVYLVELGPQTLTTRAEPEIVPKDIRITNITDNSFTVSWKTDAATLGFIRYGRTSDTLNLSALDTRDRADESERSYKNHHVTVNELDALNTYHFIVISGSEASKFDDDGSPFSVTTSASFETAASSDTAYGAVYYPDLSPAEGSLVYLTLPGSAPLSSITGASGTWAVPLSTSRTADLSDLVSYDAGSAKVEIEVYGPDGTTATATTLSGKDSPVDDIVLGKNYDFATSEVASEAKQPPESQFSLDSLGELPQAAEGVVTIENIDEGEAVNTQQPEFVGEGPPGKTLEIQIESRQTIKDSITVGNTGVWSWSPTSDLEPGEHTLTVSWVDEKGITQLLRRSFVVYAQGESSLPAFEATPSATPTPTSAPTRAPSPTSIPTPTSGISPTPTPTPTIITTITPTPRPTSEATEPAMPAPGTGWLSLGIIIFGLILMVSGTTLILFKR